MPIILPDVRSKQASVIDMNKEYGRMSKDEYENSGMDNLRKESMMICAKHLIMAIQEGKPEMIVQVFKQMFDLVESED